MKLIFIHLRHFGSALVSERIRVVMRIHSFTLPRYRAYTDPVPGCVITLKANIFYCGGPLVVYYGKKHLFELVRISSFLKRIYVQYGTIFFEKLPTSRRANPMRF